MVKVEIKQKGYELEAEDVIEAEVKEFGTGGAHIIVPKKWIGHKVIVVVKSIVKQWTGGYLKKFRKRGDKKELV